MDLSEQISSWIPNSGVFDLRSQDQKQRYNDLRAKASRGEIRHFLDGLDKGWTSYNQKELEYIVVCRWWEPRESVESSEDLEGDDA